MPNFVLKRLYK